MKYDSLTINGRRFNRLDLLERCSEKLSGDATPEWERSIYSFIATWLDDSEKIDLRTSGSTGKPKTISVFKKQMVQSAVMTGRYFRLRQGQRALLCLPAEYVAGKMMIVRAFVLGLDLVPVRPASNPLVDVPEGVIDFAAMIPLQLHTLLFETDQQIRDRLDRINTLIIGGGEINQKLTMAVKAIKPRVYATFGMTETLSHIALRPLNGPGASSVYRVLEGVRIRRDRRGCLVVQAPQAGEEELVTNDLVNLVSEDSFEWLGRVDHVIVTGGIKVIPEQVERKLENVIHGRRFFICGLPDEKLGNRVVLYVEGREWTQEETDRMRSQLKSILKPAERPKDIRFVEKFPETGSGKIRRAETIRRYSSRQE
ncbi:MAG: AMP-binding protein [FCB group bacterium]|nr:AMP-binding protein [FCB group bacterium]